MSHLVSGAVEQLGRWRLSHPEVPRAHMVDHVVDLTWNGLQVHES